MEQEGEGGEKHHREAMSCGQREVVLIAFPLCNIVCLFESCDMPNSRLPLLSYQAQIAAAEQYLESMGYLARKEVREVPISLSYTDAQNYLKMFKAFDRDGDGHIRYIHA